MKWVWGKTYYTDKPYTLRKFWRSSKVYVEELVPLKNLVDPLLTGYKNYTPAKKQNYCTGSYPARQFYTELIKKGKLHSFLEDAWVDGIMLCLYIVEPWFTHYGPLKCF